MVQRKFYFPEDMYTRLQIHAKVEGKSITDVLRELVSEGLQKKEIHQKGRGAQTLLDISKIAKKENWNGPRDLSFDHNRYFVQAHTINRKSKIKKT